MKYVIWNGMDLAKFFLHIKRSTYFFTFELLMMINLFRFPDIETFFLGPHLQHMEVSRLGSGIAAAVV